MVDIVGRFSSGKRDISRKHDTYLAGAFGKWEFADTSAFFAQLYRDDANHTGI
ncbi:hypothetical protein BPIT_25070 [Candidatus Brocadia pituitae]|nr:hypothetical protein BPIT_25070 [Candidatus Brocadia pituitae]